MKHALAYSFRSRNKIVFTWRPAAADQPNASCRLVGDGPFPVVSGGADRQAAYVALIESRRPDQAKRRSGTGSSIRLATVVFIDGKNQTPTISGHESG